MRWPWIALRIEYWHFQYTTGSTHCVRCYHNTRNSGQGAETYPLKSQCKSSLESGPDHIR